MCACVSVFLEDEFDDEEYTGKGKKKRGGSTKKKKGADYDDMEEEVDEDSFLVSGKGTIYRD